MLVTLAAVALLGVLHLIQWVHVRATAPAGGEVRLDEALRGLAGGRDPWARALLVTAVVAVCFAVAAPFVPGAVDAIGDLIPG